ncbi:hypothetical protein WMY93_017029 [Mugilogobius chulae]|uniref:Uncharacterized protein n=1 Tax=Mugilogobius chulae TaxID=88201 RepID=A0AAW0NX96_9GOBI
MHIHASGYAVPRGSSTPVQPLEGATADTPTRPGEDLYMADSGLHLYGRNSGRSSDSASSRDVSQRLSKDAPGTLTGFIFKWPHVRPVQIQPEALTCCCQRETDAETEEMTEFDSRACLPHLIRVYLPLFGDRTSLFIPHHLRL